MKALAALALTAAAIPAAAQETYVLPEITITASREETALSRSGSSVSVLGYDALTDRAAQPVTAALTRLPGVSLRQSGPLGTTGAVSVRGAPAQYVPVVIDGIDVADPSAGQPAFDMGGLTAAGLSRVELLRGTQSSLYGSRAVGGVLAMESLRPTQDGTTQNFVIEAGSYQTLLASYGIARRVGPTDLAFTATRIHSDGFSARDENDGNTEADGYDATRLSFYAAHDLQNGALIGLNGFWEDSRADFDDGGYDANGNYVGGDVYGTPGDDDTTRTSFGLRAFAEFTTGTFDHKVAATRYRIDRVSSSNGFDTPFIGARNKLSWQAGADLNATGARLIFGADTERETAEGNGRTTLNGVFAELDTPLGADIDLNASVRHDDHSMFGGFETGRIAAVWRLRDDLLLRAALGTGFRAPSLYELNGPYGDAGLRAEESQSAEIGVEKRWGEDSYLRATVFRLAADNLIGFDFAKTDCAAAIASGYAGCYAQIDGDTQRQGVEIDGRYAFANGTALSAAYTYTETDDSAASAWAQPPRHMLSLGVDHEFATGTAAGLTIRHQADRAGTLADFTVVDLAVSHPIRDGAEAYLRIENLLDEEYQLVDGYGTSDRAFYAGIRADF